MTIAAGVTAVLDGSFNRGNDIIQFAGNAASYSIVKVNASTVKITDAAGTSVTIPVGSTGTHIQFADADRVLSGSSAGIVLGDQSVTSTAVSLAAGAAPAPVEAYTLSVNAPTVTEGDTGSKTMSYKLTLDKAPTSTVTVNYETLDTGSATANDDFVPVAGAVTFAAGQTVAYVSVTVLGDTTVEAPETVKLNLSGSKLVAAVEATGTIVDNDTANQPASYTLTGSNAVTEGGSASFTLKTTGLASGSSVGYKITGSGSAATQSATGSFVVDVDGNATVVVPVDSNNTIGDSGSLTIELLNGKAPAVTATVIDGTPTTYSAPAITTTNSASGVQTINVAGSAAQTITLDTDQVTPTNGFVINSATAAVNVTSGTSNDKITLTGNGNNTISTGAGNDTVLVSGSGNNEITTGAGNDTVSITGSGSNTIRVGSGTDTVTGGSGSDTIYVDSGDLSAADRIDGGDGSDTLVVAGINNVIDATNVKNIENIVLQGTKVSFASSSVYEAFKSIQGSATTSELTITGITNGSTVDLTGVALTGIKSITLDGAGAITVKASAADLGAVGAVLKTGITTVNLQTDVAGYKSLSAADTAFNGTKTVTGSAQELIDNKAALTGAALVVSGNVTLAQISALADAGIAATKTVSMSVAELLNAAKYPDQKAALTSANTLIQVTGNASVAEAATLITNYGPQIAAYKAIAGNTGIAIADTPANVGASANNATVTDATTVSSISLSNGSGVSVADAGRIAALTFTGSYTVTDSVTAINAAIVGGVVPQSLAKASSISLSAGAREVTAISLSGTTTSGSATVAMASTTGLAVGDSVNGTGIPAGAKITAIVPNTSITLSAPATASGSPSLKFAATTNALELKALGSKLAGGFDLALTGVTTLSADDYSAIAGAKNVLLTKASGGFSVAEVNTILAQNSAAKVAVISDTALNLSLNASSLSAATSDIYVTSVATVLQANAITSAVTALVTAGATVDTGAGRNSYRIEDTKDAV